MAEYSLKYDLHIDAHLDDKIGHFIFSKIF